MLNYYGNLPPPNNENATQQILQYFENNKIQKIDSKSHKFTIDYSKLFEKENHEFTYIFNDIIHKNILKYKTKKNFGSYALWSIYVSGEIKSMVNHNILKYYLYQNNRDVYNIFVFDNIQHNTKIDTSTNSPDHGVFSPRTFKKFNVENFSLIKSIIEYIFVNII
mgnify:CR=1 FL=1|tara:strand:- start:8049 stop:8543 length:495 start_codon:yes stop_codon:yes gene_type:complete